MARRASGRPVTDMRTQQKNPHVGDRVRVERDETRYPCRGTWPQFRGRTGTVVEVNADRQRPHLTEYGVSFTKRDRAWAWFKVYELTVIGTTAPVCHADGQEGTGPIDPCPAQSPQRGGGRGDRGRRGPAPGGGTQGPRRRYSGCP